MPTAVRPRWGRICAAGAAFLVTLVTVLAGIGVLPASTSAAAATSRHQGATATLASQAVVPRTPSVATRPDPRTSRAAHLPASALETAVPAASGTGKRVVFSLSAQRVWLIGASGRVVRTYLASGSLTDNLRPGTYAVTGVSRRATGIDGGRMQYFVRFTHGRRAAIGFHTIPVKNGRLEETLDQLGTPQSAGGIRQALPDARALAAFAPVGTKVVVTA